MESIREFSQKSGIVWHFLDCHPLSHSKFDHMPDQRVGRIDMCQRKHMWINLIFIIVAKPSEMAELRLENVVRLEHRRCSYYAIAQGISRQLSSTKSFHALNGYHVQLENIQLHCLISHIGVSYFKHGIHPSLSFFSQTSFVVLQEFSCLISEKGMKIDCLFGGDGSSFVLRCVGWVCNWAWRRISRRINT